MHNYLLQRHNNSHRQMGRGLVGAAQQSCTLEMLPILTTSSNIATQLAQRARTQDSALTGVLAATHNSQYVMMTTCSPSSVVNSYRKVSVLRSWLSSPCSAIHSAMVPLISTNSQIATGGPLAL
eukprot:GHVU01219238.1.p1 GENE.GHVU01219238.1~~GHVU01219238.1.p1  ORF type:complete len:124 (+),score=4.11 GHVU01219238.1:606-977(+)